MAKTALHLSREELHTYNPAKRMGKQPAEKRWEQAWEVARYAACLLRENFQARRIVAFGSLTHEAWFTPWSDIDLAVWGISADQFYRAVATVSGISPEFEIDLVDPEECRPKVRQVIEGEGIDL